MADETRQEHLTPMTEEEFDRAAEAAWQESLADPEFRAEHEERKAKESLWLQLVRARRAAGISQQELARRRGISQAELAHLERWAADIFTVTELRRFVRQFNAELDVEIKATDVAQGRGG